MAGDAQGLLKFRRELSEDSSDLGRLLYQCGHHALGRLRLVADQFRRGDNQGQVIIDVVPHGG